MRYLILTITLIGLYGCSANELDSLVNDLERNELIELSFDVGEYEEFKCDPLSGQEILKVWRKTLKEAGIASWPHPDNYLVMSFKNKHKYRVRIFTGTNELKYSVLYSNHVYTGEWLMLESVCPGLKAHNKSLSSDALKRAG